ncbi:hypothetical protein BT96DRAFT_992116 [Gymnopus androsaceus JB14]|uniref:Uncharacterized protein n=1 Tax=Gymnopus androsaceus JB14 TaxID=1447944 RepID=A0A6A4HVW4_9AGAR|nr:hypothetical protein BT96DRAFT_992116 [Gymnopus androsaceus JB14]
MSSSGRDQTDAIPEQQYKDTENFFETVVSDTKSVDRYEIARSGKKCLMANKKFSHESKPWSMKFPDNLLGSGEGQDYITIASLPLKAAKAAHFYLKLVSGSDTSSTVVTQNLIYYYAMAFQVGPCNVERFKSALQEVTRFLEGIDLHRDNMKSLAMQAKVHEKNLIDELKTELLEDDVIGSFLEASRVNPESSQPQPFISTPLDLQLPALVLRLLHLGATQYIRPINKDPGVIGHSYLNFFSSGLAIGMDFKADFTDDDLSFFDNKSSDVPKQTEFLLNSILTTSTSCCVRTSRSQCFQCIGLINWSSSALLWILWISSILPTLIYSRAQQIDLLLVDIEVKMDPGSPSPPKEAD